MSNDDQEGKRTRMVSIFAFEFFFFLRKSHLTHNFNIAFCKRISRKENIKTCYKLKEQEQEQGH